MYLKTLASAVDVNSLIDKTHITTFGLVLLITGIALVFISAVLLFDLAFLLVFFRGKGPVGSPTRNQVITRAGVCALLVMSAGGALVLTGTQRPNPAAVSVKAFATEYPDLTLHAEDIDCIESMVQRRYRDRSESCSAIRKVDSDFAKVEFFTYQGKFAIAGPSGIEITSDADIGAPYDETSK